MLDIYVKKTFEHFAGDGAETIVVDDGVIVAHVRGWENPAVVEEGWQPSLTGQPVNKRGKGFRKLRGFQLENSQCWAEDVVSNA